MAMSNDMKLLIRAINSWKWPATLGSFTGVIVGIYFKEIAPKEATEEVIRVICLFMLLIITFSFVGINVMKLSGVKI